LAAVVCYAIGSTAAAYARLGAVTFTASAGAASSTYTYNSDATCTRKGNGNRQCCGTATTIVIDASATKVNSRSFFLCKSVVTVDFSNAIVLQVIETEAFYGANSITSIDLSGAVQLTTINVQAFRSCSALASLTLTSSITTIAGRAFQYTLLDEASAVIWNGVDCVALQLVATTQFDFECGDVPVIASTSHTACLVNAACTLSLTFDSHNSGTPAIYTKLVAPGASCGTGTSDALGGSEATVVSFSDATSGAVTFTPTVTSTNAALCFRIGDNTGAFTPVGAATITIGNAPLTTVYTYDVNAKCAYYDWQYALRSNRNTQCCGTATSIVVAALVKVVYAYAFRYCEKIGRAHV
jgi:hypothetical protein